MRASILIPAWNEAGTIERTLRSVAELHVPFSTEVIIAAGGTDNTYQLAQEWQSESFRRTVCLRQADTEGKAGALVNAIRESTGDHLLFLDADTLVPQEWLQRVVEALGTYDAVSCNYEPRSVGKVATAHALVRKWRSIGSGGHGLAGWATIGVRRDVVEDIGVDNLFPEQTGGGVDTFFYRTLQSNNCAIGFVREVNVETHLPSSISQLWESNTRWHSIYYDLDHVSLVDKMNLFGRSLTVTTAPVITLVVGAFTLLIGHISPILEDISLIIISLTLLVWALFLFKIARNVATAVQVERRAIHWAPQYLFTEYLYHVTRVVAYLLRFLGFRDPVHHFQGERD